MNKKICFDLDGVICTNTNGKYEKAEPYQDAIKKINELYEKGNYIIIYTARFMTKYKKDLNKINSIGYDFTKKQLDNWGLRYNELILGKPDYDIFIDDKAYNYSDSWHVHIDNLVDDEKI